MEYALHSSTYIVEDIPKVLLFARDANNRKVLFKVPYFPYFFVDKSDVSKLYSTLHERHLDSKILDDEGEYVGEFGHVLRKIICKEPYDVGLIRRIIEDKNPDRLLAHIWKANAFVTNKPKAEWSRIKTYEADIVFYLRFLIDSGIKTGFEYNGNVDSDIVEVSANDLIPKDVPSRLKIGIVDIETYSRTIAEMKAYKSRVIVAGFADLETGELVQFSGDDEHEVLLGVLNYLVKKDYDVIVSYSLLDIDYLLHRMAKLHIDYLSLSRVRMVSVKRGKIYGTDVLDFSEAYRRVQGEPAWNTLDFVSKKEKVGSKILLKLSVLDTWDKDPKEVIDYNRRDVELVLALERKLFLIREFLDPIRREIGCNFDDVFMANRLGDIQYLRLNKDKLKFLSRSPFKFEGSYWGAIVKLIRTGIFKNVLVLDWSEMYPSIIENLNIGWNTWDPVDGDIVIEDAKFTSKEESWTTTILRGLRNIRSNIKKEVKLTTDPDKIRVLKTRSAALKSVINAAYGCYGFAGMGDKYKEHPARLYCPPIARSITAVGRTLLTESIDFIKSLGYVVIYGDTDSLFVLLNSEDVDKEGKLLKESLETHVKEYALHKWKLKSVSFSIDIDKVFTRFILLKKKRYHGLLFNGEEEIKGLEIVRKDVAEYTVDVEHIIGSLMLHDAKKEEIESAYTKALSDVVRGKVPVEKMCIKGRCNKEVYTTKSMTWRALQAGKVLLNQDIGVGERFYWVFVKSLKTEDGINITSFKADNVTYQLDVIASKLPEFPKGIVIDLSAMATRIIRKPLRKYINLKKSSEIKTLTDFFA